MDERTRTIAVFTSGERFPLAVSKEVAETTVARALRNAPEHPIQFPGLNSAVWPGHVVRIYEETL